MMLLDPQTGSILDANPYISKLLGYTKKQLTRKKFWLFSGDQKSAEIRDAFGELQSKYYLRKFAHPLETQSGEIIYVDLVCNAYELDGRKIAQCNLHDVTDQKRMIDELIESRDQLREQSIRDHLTGLFNRRYLEETLEREILRCFREMNPLDLIMLDINDFRNFNNAHGHDAGDNVLKKLGQLLNEQVRAADVSARFGGDEFMVIMPNASRKITLRRADKIRQNAGKMLITHEGENLGKISLSMGVAIFPEDGTNSVEMVKAADHALYQAKNDPNQAILSPSQGVTASASRKNICHPA